LLKQLAAAGVSIIVAEEEVDIRIASGQPLKLKVGHVAICQKGQEPKTVWVAKGIQARV
jgi:hypothetical protein